VVARFVVKSTLIIVPPSHVVTAFADLLSRGELQTHVYASGLEFLAGFGLAAVASPASSGTTPASSRVACAGG
jgi:ABC-type nitrate/sulfonate/bicarbonate transport system permease component